MLSFVLTSKEKENDDEFVKMEVINLYFYSKKSPPLLYTGHCAMGMVQ